MFSSQGKNLSQLAEEARDISRDSIAALLYERIDASELWRLGELFQALANEIKIKAPQASVFISEPLPAEENAHPQLLIYNSLRLAIHDHPPLPDNADNRLFAENFMEALLKEFDDKTQIDVIERICTDPENIAAIYASHEQAKKIIHTISRFFTATHPLITTPSEDTPSATEYYALFAEGKAVANQTDFGSLNILRASLKRVVVRNELALSLDETSEAFAKLGELIQQRNLAVGELQNKIPAQQIEDLQSEAFDVEEINDDFAYEDEDEIPTQTSGELFRKIEKQKDQHTEILADYLDEVGDTSMSLQDFIKVMINSIDEIYKYEILEPELDAYSDSSEEATPSKFLPFVETSKSTVEDASTPSYPESDDDTDDEDEEDEAENSYADILELIALRKEKNREAALLADGSEQAEEKPADAVADFSDFFADNNGVSDLLLLRQNFDPLSRELSEVPPDFIKQRPHIIRDGLIEFTAAYINSEPRINKLIKEKRLETNILVEKNYSLDSYKKEITNTVTQLFQKIVPPQDTKEFTQEMLKNIAHERTGGIAKASLKNKLLIEMENLLSKTPATDLAKKIDDLKKKYIDQYFMKQTLDELSCFLEQIIEVANESDQEMARFLLQRIRTTADPYEPRIPTKLIISEPANPQEIVAILDVIEPLPQSLIMSVMDVGLFAETLSFTYLPQTQADEANRTELVKSAEDFIFSITGIDFENSDYEILLKEMFREFITKISSCDAIEAENLFHEILLRLPLPGIEKSCYASRLLAAKIDSIYKAAYDTGLKIEKITADFIHGISSLDLQNEDSQSKLKQLLQVFIQKCALEINIDINANGSLNFNYQHRERERLKTIFAAINYLKYLKISELHQPELQPLLKLAQKNTQTSMQNLLELDLKIPEHRQQLTTITIGLLQRSALESKGNDVQAAPVEAAASWWLTSWIPTSFTLFSPAPTSEETARKEKLKDEQRTELLKRFPF